MKRLFGIFFLLLATIYAFGQTPKQKPDKDLEKANQFINEKNYDKALEIFLQKYQEEKTDKYALKIADMYHRLGQEEKSLQWFKDVKYLDKAEKRYLLVYADVNKELGYLKTAFDYYLMYAIEANDAEGVYEKAYACENLLKASKKSVLYQLKPLSFNTADNDEYVGMLRNNQIIGTDRSIGKNALFPLTDFYMLQREYDKWLEPVKVLKANVTDTARTSLTYTEDGNIVFFTQTPFAENKAATKGYQVGRSQIIMASNAGNRWSDLKLLPLSPGYSSKDPAVNADGSVLYFSSNMPGGFGGYDLYEVKQVNGVWGKPKNLGEDVNTKYDEVLPFIRQDGILKNHLYFSCNNPDGFGGWDIYECSYELDKWTNTEILPPPINSSGDDKSIVFDLNNYSGYFASNRNGGAGGYDIYRFEPYDLKLEVSAVDKSNAPLGFAEINIFLDDIAFEQGLTNTDGKTVVQLGKGQNYVVVVQKPGYKQVSQKISTAGKNNGEVISINAVLEQDVKLANNPQNANLQAAAQNYILFKGEVVAKDKGKVALAAVKMINMENGKIKQLVTDINGKFEQALFINKTYKIYITKGDYKIEDDITTFAMEPGSEMYRDFVFKTTSDVFALMDKNDPNYQAALLAQKNNPTKPTTNNNPTPTTAPQNNPKPNTKPEYTPIVVPTVEPAVVNVEPTTQNKPNATEPKEKIEPVIPPQNKPIIEPVVNTPQPVTKPEPQELLAVNTPVTTSPDNLLVYKIQLGAYQDKNMDFSNLNELGKIEAVPSKSGQYIYTLGDFTSLDEAKRKLDAVRENGMFVAFIVGYLKDEKVGIYR
ncbi:MAG: hypothetical protein K1X55_15365 [Chitinophagales bacterium]|nr:hypothetical protein [Chitinophagales bacterium]